LEASPSAQKEKQLNDLFKKRLNAQAEVKTDVVYIDLLTNTMIIEVKTGYNCKHVVG
jgi:hypothetical protein